MSKAVEAMSPEKISSNRLLANRKLSRVTIFSHFDQILVLLTGGVMVSCWANSEIGKGRICQASSSVVKQDHFNPFVWIEFSCDGHKMVLSVKRTTLPKNHDLVSKISCVFSCSNESRTNKKTPTKTLYCHRRIFFPSFTIIMGSLAHNSILFNFPVYCLFV